jgi:hypothetical protein
MKLQLTKKCKGKNNTNHKKGERNMIKTNNNTKTLTT